MSADWKPGDLAMVTRNGLEVVAQRYFTGSEHGWWDGSGVVDYFDPDPDTTPRRLVVIDPNDRASIERLRDIFDREVIKQNDDPDPRDVSPSARASAMQAALREFANPTPRIDEPRFVGAVVEDAKGRRFTRTCDCGNDTPHWRANRSYEGGKALPWSDVKAVRVLSEGVTA